MYSHASVRVTFYLNEYQTVVYEINVFYLAGFASTDDPDSHSNYGMWDMLLALQFVRDNIRNFGGDPDKVNHEKQNSIIVLVTMSVQKLVDLILIVVATRFADDIMADTLSFPNPLI